MVWGSRWQQASEDDDELPAAEEELQDSLPSSLQGSAGQEGSEVDSFVDDRSDSEIEAEGVAALAAEQPEVLLLGGGGSDDEAAPCSSEGSPPGASLRQQEVCLSLVGCSRCGSTA
jgi:hypothetical protein